MQIFLTLILILSLGANYLLPTGLPQPELWLPISLHTTSNHLVSISNHQSKIRNSYDPAGNRTSQTVNGQETGYVYDAANRLMDAGGVSFSWDDNGNLLSDGINTYTYDAANRLVSISNPQSTTPAPPQVRVTNSYDGLGNRYQQTVNGQTTTDVLDIAGSLSQVLSDGTSNYLYGLGRLGQQTDATLDYFLPDALGSVRQITDDDGMVTLGQAYDPYGNLLTQLGRENSNYSYAGEWTDPPGLINLRARYYDPTQGRFLTRDPVAGILNQPTTVNHYVYALNNPVSRIDPSGKNPLLLVGALGGLLGGSIYGYGSQVIRNLNQGMCFWGVLSTNIDAGQIAFYAITGVVIGTGLGALAIGGQALISTIGVSSVPTINFLETELPRVQHIMQAKHAWDLITPLTGDLSQDYNSIQPYISQTVQSVGNQIANSPLGPVMQFTSNINNQQVVVNAIKLIDGTLNIVDAWVGTR